MRLSVSLLVALLVAVVVALVYRANAVDARADLRAVQAELRTTEAALETSEWRRQNERARANRMFEIAVEAEEERSNAEETGDRVTADLLADNLRLQEHWRSCQAARLPGVDAATGEPDAAAERRAESAGRIVRAAAECDAQVRGLQRVIGEYLAADDASDR